MTINSPEKDLRTFLNVLGVSLPLTGRDIGQNFTVTDLSAGAASVFQAKDNKAVLLGYRLDGVVYPISVFFMTSEDTPKFGHSSMLLASYEKNPSPLPVLRAATESFFKWESSHLLSSLYEGWRDTELAGIEDKRMLWEQPNFLTDFFKEHCGEIPSLPVFPSVYHFNNPYLKPLLEALEGDIRATDRVLVMGAGAGVEAAVVSSKLKMPVDAVDINPVAIANTKVVAAKLGAEDYVSTWVSDGFSDVQDKYDCVIFNAPLAVNKNHSDANRFDSDGAVLKKVLGDLKSHLTEKGRLFLMSHRDLSPYLPKDLEFKVKSSVPVNQNLAILEVSAR